MSTSTGNVKISQLDALSTIDNGSKLVFPVSKDGGNAGAPDWASFSVKANVLSNFIGNHLQITNTGGLKDRVTNLAKNLDTITDSYNTLEEYLGKYNYTTVTEININSAIANKYISTSGQQTTNNLYSISNVISLKQGNLYLFNPKFNNTTYDVSTYPADLSLISKVSTHQHSKGTDTVYEPLSNLYKSNGSPTFHGYVVFFATEDMDVVISCRKTAISTNTNKLREVKYGAFIEAASRLLTVNGELMKVLVEAIVKNRKDIDTINENLNSFGDIHVNSIDCDDYPSVQGEPMVIVKNRYPGEDDGTQNKTHGPDVPTRIGQIWVDTKGGNAYIAVKLGATGADSWKKITTA